MEELRHLIQPGSLAEVARRAGIHRQRLSEYVRGKRRITIEAAVKLSAALEGAVAVEELVDLPAGAVFRRDEPTAQELEELVELRQVKARLGTLEAEGDGCAA